MVEIIAELCQNHNGDINLLKRMIKSAAEAGADYVKIQSMLADEISFRARFEKGEKNKDGKIISIKRTYQNEYDRLKALDLDDDAHYIFIEECDKNNVKPLTTAFTRSRIPFLASLPWPEKTIKVSSFDCISLPLLNDLINAGFNKLFISTGTVFDNELEKTANLLSSQNVEFTFLHCISIYPTPLQEGHLNRINYLKQFSDNVGFSEHSEYEKDQLKLSICSLTYDISVIERHFTIIDKKETKDGIVSLDKKQLSELVSFSKKQLSKYEIIEKNIVTSEEFETIAGDANRDLRPTELLNRDYYQGRFVSKNSDGSLVYNWEDKTLF